MTRRLARDGTLTRIVRAGPTVIRRAAIFVTENPAVLRAATVLGAGAPAIVCTEGTPSAAAHRLLSHAPDATLWWRNDFDWPGVRMSAAALTRVSQCPSVAHDGGRLPIRTRQRAKLVGTPAATPWDPDLVAAMHAVGRAVTEERLLPTLLDDLR